MSGLLDETGVRAIYQAISNWGRWGEHDDQAGTLNLIGPAERRAALALVTEGVSIGLGRLLDAVPSPMNPLPAQHYMTAAGDLMPARGPGVAYDYVGIFPHGQAQSHVDALCHISHDGRLFGGREPAVVTSRGATALAITTMADGIVGRGVFLDVATARGVAWIDPANPIRPADLERAERLAGVKVGRGDILVYRTGRHERRAEAGAACERLEDGSGHLPGLYPDCLRWLGDREVAVLASDCAHDVLPSPIAGERIPIHVGTEVYLGMPLVHSLELDRLAAMTRRLGRAAFAVTIAPLRIAGATASPVNPVALF